MMRQSLFREFAEYVSLSVLGTLGVSCYILADTFFVAKGLGTNGLAALNLAIPVFNFIHGSGLMIGMGGATRYAVLRGSGQRELADRVYTHGVYLGVLFSAGFALAGLFLSGALSAALGADGNTFAMTNTYLRWLLLFAPAFIFNDLCLCFVRNDGEPKLAMCAMVVGSFSNIFLDYLFIFPMNMGILGAVLATGASSVISMMVMAPYWVRRKNGFHLVRARWQAGIAGQELSLGFPSLIGQVSSGIVMIVYNGIILGLEGNTGVAAYGVIANISLVVAAVFTGIAQGVQPLMSRFYGAGDRRGIYDVLGYGVAAAMAVSAAVYAFLYGFAQPVSCVFNSEGNREMERIAVAGIRLYFLSAPFAGYNMILATFFTSADKVLPAHVLSVLWGLVLIVPLSFLMAALWGMSGVWMAYPVTELVAGAAGYGVYRRCRKGEFGF